jgi:endonuclease/exonuclease/phosphatase (EEP) superfamily protein YafD
MTAPPGQLRPVTPPPPDGPGPGRTRRRWLGYLVGSAAALVLTVAGAVALLPDLLGLDIRTPFTQLIAFRQWELAAGLGVLLVLLVLVRFARRARPFLVPLSVGASAVLLVGGALVLPRVVADPEPTTGTPLTVLSFNVYEGRADVTALAAAIAARRPDLVSLPEAGPRFAAKLQPLVEPLGYRIQTSRSHGADVSSVTALVSTRLGDVSFRVGDDARDFPYLEATGGALGPLRFVAFHAASPVPRRVGSWVDDLALLPQWCAAGTPAIVAGDFNATLDHSALRAGMAGCSDAADQRGDGLLPTWSPSRRSRFVGPQIDHVIMTPGIAAQTFEVLDLPGSDHLPILSTLRLP